MIASRNAQTFFSDFAVGFVVIRQRPFACKPQCEVGGKRESLEPLQASCLHRHSRCDAGYGFHWHPVNAVPRHFAEVRVDSHAVGSGVEQALSDSRSAFVVANVDLAVADTIVRVQRAASCWRFLITGG